MESFSFRDDEFKILVRNANVDIKEAIENGASGIRGETGARERNSRVIHEHGNSYIQVAGPELPGGEGSWKYLSALSSLLDSKGHESGPLFAACVAVCHTQCGCHEQWLPCSRCSIGAL